MFTILYNMQWTQYMLNLQQRFRIQFNRSKLLLMWRWLQRMLDSKRSKYLFTVSFWSVCKQPRKLPRLWFILPILHKWFSLFYLFFWLLFKHQLQLFTMPEQLFNMPEYNLMHLLCPGLLPDYKYKSKYLSRVFIWMFSLF